MWRRFWWLIPAVAAVACTGLYLENGNAYPCDFSKGPGVRDAACIAGDVCGSNNLCRKYLYEGPRFEGPATIPVYGPNSGEGALLHPLALSEPVLLVSHDLPFEGLDTSYFVFTDAGIYQVDRLGRLTKTALEAPPAPPAVTDGRLVAAQPFATAGVRSEVLLQWKSGELSVATIPLTGPLTSSVVRVGITATPLSANGFQVVPLPPPGLANTLPLAWTGTDLGSLQKAGPTWRYVAFDGGTAFSGAGVLALASLTRQAEVSVLALTEQGLFVAEPDGGASQVDSFAALTLLPAASAAHALRTDRDGRILAATRSGLFGVGDPGEVLSTFQVTMESTGPVLERTWPDCRPCPLKGQRAEVVAPSISTGTPVVEVLCVGTGPTEALRVVGSVALSQDERCLTQSLELALPATRVARAGERFVQWHTQSGVALGGRHGELWTGETLSDLLPFFLDRVPRDVTSVTLPTGEPLLAAITDDYLAVQQTASTTTAREALNGFRRVPTRELQLAENTRLLGFVRGSGGWAVSDDGEVGRATATDTGFGVAVGPVLVTASNQPIRDSIGGEGFIATDGGLAALFVAADDSLYFVEDPEASLNPLEDREALTPDLTPEPSVPIRSLALERTPLGTDGKGRARGYLVTSRNVYSWQLAGTPARWSSTPLVLAGGEPKEVWFDSPRSALGRVGFSDGQIYSLPGGYELAEALPADDEGVPAQVLDYENLGGWPVAYATTGVFVAGWDQVNGKLQNRFPDGGINRPMSWRELTLPDGTSPWMRPPPKRDARPGRLFVAVDPLVTAADGTKTQAHRLLLFLDDQVLQVARHVRSLK